MVECFRTGQKPLLTFHDGVAVVEMLMALYRSAETNRTVLLAEEDLTTYIPSVAKGEFRG
jgi:predicted dehydrogenase